MEARGADVDVLGLDALLGQQLLQGLEHRRLARGLLRPFGPSDLRPYCFKRKPPASLTSNSASLRLPAPKSTARNDFVFSIYCCGIQADKTLAARARVNLTGSRWWLQKTPSPGQMEREKMSWTEKKAKGIQAQGIRK